MAAIADLSDLVHRMSGGSSGTPDNLWFMKSARIGGAAATAPIAGRWASLWTYDGIPGAGAAPTTVAIPDNTTNGGLKQADPGGGRQKWAVSAGACGLNAGTLLIYDRLLHIGNLSGTTTTAQTVGGTLTRYTNGVGNFAFIEIYTQIGASSTTVTMQYDGASGATNQVGPAVDIGNTNFREATRVIMLPVNAGETGITNVDNVDLLATTGTAGNFGVTVGHPLCALNLASPGYLTPRFWTQGFPGLPEVLTDACLAMLWLPGNASAPEVVGCLSMVEA